MKNPTVFAVRTAQPIFDGKCLALVEGKGIYRQELRINHIKKETAVVAVHIGTSGWSYPDWTNVLYREGWPAERRLDYYARQFNTVELNASYYRWSSDSAFAAQLRSGWLSMAHLNGKHGRAHCALNQSAGFKQVLCGLRLAQAPGTFRRETTLSGCASIRLWSRSTTIHHRRAPQRRNDIGIIWASF